MHCMADETFGASKAIEDNFEVEQNENETL